MNSNKKLSISVIIPARDAAKTLAQTLTALQSNTIQPDEILVINGLSQDETTSIAKEFGCKLLSNQLIHTAAARQAGIEVAKGEIIAMTDSDCIPPRDWLEKISYHFIQDSELDGVGGIVQLSKSETRVQEYCALKAIEGIPISQELIVIKGMRGRFAGSNCAYKRIALYDIGGYDLRFKAHASDIDLFWRLIDSKKRLLFDPDLAVEHLGFSKNLTILARKSFGYGIGSANLALSHFKKRSFELFFYSRALRETIKECFFGKQPKYPDCVFIDKLMFAFGRTWGMRRKKYFS